MTVPCLTCSASVSKPILSTVAICPSDSKCCYKITMFQKRYINVNATDWTILSIKFIRPFYMVDLCQTVDARNDCSQEFNIKIECCQKETIICLDIVSRSIQTPHPTSRRLANTDASVSCPRQLLPMAWKQLPFSSMFSCESNWLYIRHHASIMFCRYITQYNSSTMHVDPSLFLQAPLVLIHSQWQEAS